ncbi:MAG: formimidoylglutamate deiminase [Pseudomonadota bacterium]|nr:formimidoylglutamate deiminase [Pseudomonadota bacterium]
MPDAPLFADYVWLDRGFSTDVRIDIDAAPRAVGIIAKVQTRSGRGDDNRIGRYVVPGMPNLHSHAFQRAMVGLAETRALVPSREDKKARSLGRNHRQGAEDSFWTWREVMYAFAGRLDPDDLRAIAAQLYVEMLKAGYTQVCEFHYLHHQPDGHAYADAAAMSLALIEAAHEAGIGLTLLPVLYMVGGFDGRALGQRQRRFGHDVDHYLRLVERLRDLQSPMLNVGIAMHSLRAVPEDAMRAVLDADCACDCPIHIHIAEQIGEVQDCLAIRKARPVEWLLDHAAVDARWCLVHATHMSEEETRRLAATGAVAGLCPTTEANLGDGLFPLKTYLDAGGAIGIGSDSQISVSPVEELRWLEYGQRLITKHRNVSADSRTPSTGENVFGRALAGGARASGVAIGQIDGSDTGRSNGLRADLLVLDDASPLLGGRDVAHVIDTWLFAGNSNLVRDVMVGGEWIVRTFRHRDEERIASRYRGVAERLARTA